jgi:phosphatidylglycerophosphate synthase
VTATVATRATAADFRARNRGGGLFTETVNQRIGSYLSVAADRTGAPPTVLTLLNLVIGLGTSTAVVGLAGWMRSGTAPALAVGLAALVGWHLAYSLDCADGQLARVTGQTSPAGARVDVLCDVALQISLVTVVATVSNVYQRTPVWLVGAFAGTWMVNLVTSVMQQGTAAQSLIASRSPVVRVVKLIRDYGAVVTLIALVLAFTPQWTIWVIAAFTLVNGLFLLTSIVAAARASMRPGGA